MNKNWIRGRQCSGELAIGSEAPIHHRVNHDRLLAKIAERVGDKRLLKLTRAFLQAGVMENGR